MFDAAISDWDIANLFRAHNFFPFYDLKDYMSHDRSIFTVLNLPLKNPCLRVRDDTPNYVKNNFILDQQHALKRF